ncbi:MAG: FISUMP domain-containing protein [Bacteroidales bacterium]
MKKTLLLLIFILLSLSTLGQSDYSRGFQNGYKAGYCYNDYGCISPIPPVTPIPLIGESQDNYQDGYNRGFKQGLEDKQAKKSSSSYNTESQEYNSAPVLQDEYNPVELIQNLKKQQFQAQKAQYEQTEKYIADGMKRYSLEIEGWEDQKGYEEISKGVSLIQNIFIEATNKGLNLITPHTSDELMLYNAMNESMNNVRNKYYVWQSQKLMYRAAEKIIYDQMTKNESERTINIDSTRSNMRTLLNTSGILNRSKITENLIVYKQVGNTPMTTLSSSIGPPKETSSFIDTRNGQTYNTAKIGSQTWMTENLKSTKYNDGTPIPLITTNNAARSNLEAPAYCWYNNDSSNFKATYGALYNWYAVSTDKLCPKGWHVPSNDEWTTLINYLGGLGEAGGKLKEIGMTHWKSPNTSATNESGFTALPSGAHSTGTSFITIGYIGGWWSLTEYNTDQAWIWCLIYDASNVTKGYTNKRYGYSVRCVKDN